MDKVPVPREFSSWKLIYKPLIIFPGVPIVLLFFGHYGLIAAVMWWVAWSALHDE